jgi:hypothetical protein
MCMHECISGQTALLYDDKNGYIHMVEHTSGLLPELLRFLVPFLVVASPGFAEMCVVQC